MNVTVLLARRARGRRLVGAKQRYSEGTLPVSEFAEREIARIRRDSEREMKPVKEPAEGHQLTSSAERQST